MIKGIVKSLPSGVKQSIYSFIEKNIYKYGRLSYSQEGEDLILSRLIGNKNNGLFVDVGAHHPFRFSNTYFFYKRGWRGINMDAMPDSMAAFRRHRPYDVNLEIAISKMPQTLTYYVFNEPAINSFDRELSESRIADGVYTLIRKIEIKTKTLGEILSENLKEGDQIDFLSVDVEGLDHEVLESNDWNRFKPRYVLVELYNFSIDTIDSNQTYQLLRQMGYHLAAKAVHTVIFKKT